MKTVALRSLGCKVNAYETEGIQQILQQNGYLIVPFDSVADVYIVNTCSVTNIADRKSRQMLHRAKNRNPNAVVVACGCYVQTGYETLSDDPSVDIIVGNNSKKDMAEILREYFDKVQISDGSDFRTEFISHKNDEISAAISKPTYIKDMSETREYEEMRIDSYPDRTRGFIKIQDGCNRFCTYCVIPYARGRVRSRRMEDVVAEAKRLADDGCKEIVLTGIHISSYGTDRGSNELLILLRRLNDIDGLKRIRLSSLEPGIITEDFVVGINELNKVCPHFHLSMQSGSAGVLKRMNRHYTPDEYYDRVCLLREHFSLPAITTDVITGFPGETDEEFRETCEFIKKVNFFMLHVFKYSRRDGTAAADMPCQIPEREKVRRSEILIELGRELTAGYMRLHKGMRASLLTEEIKNINGIDYMIGHTPEYICAGVPMTDADYSPNRFIDGTCGDIIGGDTMLFIPDRSK